jgi:hypothetical protein
MLERMSEGARKAELVEYLRAGREAVLHIIGETDRHAGHADIVREMIDGETGARAGNSNMPTADAAKWSSYRSRLEEIARTASA